MKRKGEGCRDWLLMCPFIHTRVSPVAQSPKPLCSSLLYCSCTMHYWTNMTVINGDKTIKCECVYVRARVCVRCVENCYFMCLKSLPDSWSVSVSNSVFHHCELILFTYLSTEREFCSASTTNYPQPLQIHLLLFRYNYLDLRFMKIYGVFYVVLYCVCFCINLCVNYCSIHSNLSYY